MLNMLNFDTWTSADFLLSFSSPEIPARVFLRLSSDCAVQWRLNALQGRLQEDAAKERSQPGSVPYQAHETVQGRVHETRMDGQE